jgi:hypothetical protein
MSAAAIERVPDLHASRHGSVGGDPANDLADNVSDAFRPHLGAVLAVPGISQWAPARNGVDPPSRFTVIRESTDPSVYVVMTEAGHILATDTMWVHCDACFWTTIAVLSVTESCFQDTTLCAQLRSLLLPQCFQRHAGRIVLEAEGP